MFIIASDYDGTLYHEGKLLGDVVSAVTEWRGRGNRFGIVTGRDFSMIRPEIERWNIPVDFVVCINGAAVYDEQYRLLASHLLDDALIPRILAHPAAKASQHLQMSGLDPLRVHLRSGSLFWDSGIVFKNLTEDEAAACRNIGQVSLAYPDETEALRWTEAVNRELGDIVRAHRNKRMMDITKKGVSKALGVASVLEAKGWAAGDVRAVGDGTNDVPMILAYHGFAVSGASEDAVRAAGKVYENVPALLADLEK